MGEVIVQSFIKQHQVDAVICRLSTIYGYSKNQTDTEFFEFINKAISRENILIQKEDSPQRDNLYIDDAVCGIIKVAEKGKINNAYNISSFGEEGNFASIDQIAKIIVNLINKKYQNKKIKLYIKIKNPLKEKQVFY